jgi:hypothetical protein
MALKNGPSFGFATIYPDGGIIVHHFYFFCFVATVVAQTVNPQ